MAAGGTVSWHDRPMPDASLAEIAAELYAGSPDRFVAERNARAAEVADRDAAAQIRALRKPSVAAWVVNVFARERAAELAEALDLAEQLREAQASLDAAALAELGRQRRALTFRLAQDAVSLASERGGPVSASTAEAVRQTITAAFFDPDAAAAVASGRLVRELEPSGAFPLDAIAAVGDDPGASGGSARQGASGGSASAGERSATAKRDAAAERRKAEAAVRAAEQHLRAAQRDRAKVDLELADLSRRIDELSNREQELQSELARIRTALDDARTRSAGAGDRRAEADAAVDAADAALDTARARLP
jgi:hypothetical protein